MLIEFILTYCILVLFDFYIANTNKKSSNLLSCQLVNWQHVEDMRTNGHCPKGKVNLSYIVMSISILLDNGLAIVVDMNCLWRMSLIGENTDRKPMYRRLSHSDRRLSLPWQATAKAVTVVRNTLCFHPRICYLRIVYTPACAAPYTLHYLRVMYWQSVSYMM